MLFLKILHEVQDLSLDRHIQGRHRLIAHNEFRIQRQGPRNADALPPPPVQLMRIGIGKPAGQSHCIHQFFHPFLPFLPGRIYAVNFQRLHDDLTDRQTRIQRRKGILKDDLHLLPQTPDLLLIRIFHMDTIKNHFTGGGRKQVQNCSAKRGFSASGFPYDAQRLPAFQRKCNVIDCMELSFSRFEIFFQVVDLKQNLIICHITVPPDSNGLHASRDISQNAHLQSQQAADHGKCTPFWHKDSADRRNIPPADCGDPASGL